MLRIVSLVLLCAVSMGLAACNPVAEIDRQVRPFTEGPSAPRPDPMAHTGCEVKGSGAYNPCRTDKPLKTEKEAVKPVPVSQPRPRFTPSQCETGPQAMFPVLGAMVSGTLDDLQMYCESIGYGADGSRPSSPSRAVSSGAGGEGCENPFGGRPAPAGQFICSDRGELQACQCSGGGCSLLPTGSFLCTAPGAVIR